ncbi:hypothetical protein P3X46_002261 [Hevea brasiliensis]|uniref:EF-hand domain-containing protein n=1 Tax=Hevea brasiliensis TaxID=3981 RepID=A0ABQ9N4N5_HEVBR|nr:hypothetical protein P3X46_002261 [Hevea brasiliensis]
MAFMANHGIPENGRREMTVEELQRWLKSFETDKDGQKSKEELADAIRATGGFFARWTGKRGI